MSRRRVVVTGVGLATPIGNDLETACDALRTGRHGIGARDDWSRIADMAARLAAEVKGLDLETRWPRKTVRSMGRVALLAAYASERAIEDAGLPEALVRGGRTGLAYGSTQGSSGAHEEWAKKVYSGAGGLKGVQSVEYLKLMSHTCPANLAMHFGIRGRVISTCSACVSSSQAIGFGYETIRGGMQDVMICGGAEEMHFTHVGTFDVMYAASRKYNDHPELSPRPFDAARDGLVVGEGAGTLVLEELDHARARGARIHAEVLGFATTSDGSHMTSPSVDGMASTMRDALADAGLPPERIDYINAHATGTELGDICESLAVQRVLGVSVPVSSTKSYTGHTLGACGSIEAALCIGMMQRGFAAPNRNLVDVDPRCAPLAFVRGAPLERALEVVMSNNFAFGGLNTSLVFGSMERRA